MGRHPEPHAVRARGRVQAARTEGDKVAFSLEDADLPELVRVIGELTGKRFIFGGKVRNIKATVFSPQKVTVAEAYQAFLSILETNGLTVIPHGRFFKIVETRRTRRWARRVYVAGQAAPAEDRYVTRIHRARATSSADDVANVLGHFKTKDGDITVYAPGNLLIITDTGANIQRMMRILEDVDVGGAGDQIWIRADPLRHRRPTSRARLNEVFDLKAARRAAARQAGRARRRRRRAATCTSRRSSPTTAATRSSSSATERAYLRILEFIKRLDVPQSGEGEIHVLPLQHADAVELSKTLNEIITGARGRPPARAAERRRSPGRRALDGIFESGVKVSADKATNSIVVTSSPARLRAAFAPSSTASISPAARCSSRR